MVKCKKEATCHVVSWAFFFGKGRTLLHPSRQTAPDGTHRVMPTMYKCPVSFSLSLSLARSVSVSVRPFPLSIKGGPVLFRLHPPRVGIVQETLLFQSPSGLLESPSLNAKTKGQHFDCLLLSATGHRVCQTRKEGPHVTEIIGGQDPRGGCHKRKKLTWCPA